MVLTSKRMEMKANEGGLGHWLFVSLLMQDRTGL